MNKIIKISEGDLSGMVGNAINEYYRVNESNGRDQWKHEAKLFMDGLRSGNVIVDGDVAYVQIFKRVTASNDPRYVYIRKGDDRLHDDHFYIQDSPKLSNRTLNAIYGRLGWSDEDRMYESVKIRESDLRKIVCEVVNEIVDSDEYRGLEPDPEEKRAQMENDWDGYTTGVETQSGYNSMWDDTNSIKNLNSENQVPGMWSLMAQGYDKYNTGGEATPRNRMMAQEFGSDYKTSNRNGNKNWEADVNTLNNGGDIDSDGTAAIAGMSGAYNGMVATRPYSTWDGKYETDYLEQY